MWLYYPVKIAIFINIILLAFLVVFIKNGYEIYDKLHVKDDEAISGQFRDFSQYENMYDLDSNGRNKNNQGNFATGMKATNN